MKKIYALLTFLILVGIFIPAVSADEILYDEDLVQFIDTSINGERYSTGSTGGGSAISLRFDDITLYPQLSYIVADVPGHEAIELKNGSNDFEYFFNGETRPGVIYKSVKTNLLGTITRTKLTIFLNDWDIGNLTGRQDIALPFPRYAHFKGFTSGDSPVYICSGATGYSFPGTAYYTVASTISWKNHITIIEESQLPGYNIDLERTILGDMYTSTINCTLDDTVLFTNTGHGTSVNVWYPHGDIDTVKVTNPDGTEYIYALSEAGPDDPTGPGAPVTVYVRNSQTGALLANAHINISASVNGNFHEVVNETVPSGIYSIDLQPTGGGMPNPDFYRLIVTAEGYNSILPYFDFEADRATKIYAYLDPTGGAPENENNTFIDFYVRDMSANPISGATVNFGGYTLITNSAGYTIFEVEKSKTYSWTVSKSGYGSLTGNAVIGSNGRHTINTVLAPAVTPTIPTAIPTSTPISPTPTLTAPTGEPVSNWLEWFAAHFGMILGGGVEIGKIFMWLCFAVPVGVYVGKEAKAGAAGFMAGAGIVTLFFVLIGWVPIWLLVLLALIIGLLYAKVFNNSDTGGGR